MHAGMKDANFDSKFRSANQILIDLPRTNYAAPCKWILHVAVFERPRDPVTMRPVKVSFFNDRVVEVGSCILHVPVQSGEDSLDDDSGKKAETGRPALDPFQLLLSA